jgi:hypothetical protein
MLVLKALTETTTNGCYAATTAARAQFVDQRHHDASATGAQLASLSVRRIGPRLIATGRVSLVDQPGMVSETW